MSGSQIEEDAKKFHCHVINDVIEAVRNLFINEGVSEEHAIQLKKIWTQKLTEAAQRKRPLKENHNAQ